MVDHSDDVLVGDSLRTRIRDHLSADNLNAFFEGDENMRDDLPFDDEDDELTKGFRDLQYQARNGNVYAMYRLSRIHLDENSKYYHEAWGDHFLERSAEGGYHVAQYAPVVPLGERNSGIKRTGTSTISTRYGLFIFADNRSVKPSMANSTM